MSEYVELTDLPRGHVSPSAMAKLARCPWSYRLRYVDDMKGPIGSNLIRGRCIHQALEWASVQQMREGRRPEATAVSAYFRDIVPIEIVKAQDESGYPVEWHRTKGRKLKDGAGRAPDAVETVDTLLEAGISALHMYEMRRPPYEPLLVEQKCTVEFEGLPWTLVVVPDLYTVDRRLVDYKSVASAPSDNAAALSDQLTAGQIGLEQSGMPVDRLELHYLVLLKKEMKLIVQECPPRTDEQKAAFLDNMAAIIRAARAGSFYRVNDTKTCSWCEYRTQCNPIWKQEETDDAE